MLYLGRMGFRFKVICVLVRFGGSGVFGVFGFEVWGGRIFMVISGNLR